ncbi:MAG: hypothetical protein AAF800_04120 [Planctomycetota bacterium]
MCFGLRVILWFAALTAGRVAAEPAAWPETLPRDEAGFTVVEPPPGARVIHVAADGDDANGGYSPDAPMRSLKRAAWKVRPYSSDQILLKAGDTFEGGFGLWNRSGVSAERPLLIGVYGQGDRPIVRCHDEPFLRFEAARINHVVVQGIHATAARRDAASPDFAEGRVPYRLAGVLVYATGQNLLIEDCRLDHFNFNLVAEVVAGRPAYRNLVLRRTIVTNAWNHWSADRGGGHSSGLYATRVAGLTVEECVFDRNGWNPDAEGGGPTKFNHNLYLQPTVTGVSVRGSVIARAAAHGLQLRGGGVTADNLFWSNPMAMFTRAGAIRDNAVVDGRDLSPRRGDARGQGLMVLGSARQPLVTVERNVVARKLGRAEWYGAIEIDHPRDGVPAARAVLRDNAVWRWDPPVVGADHAERGDDTRVLTTDPGVDGFHAGGVAGLVAAAVARPRGTWDPRISAAAYVDHLQANAGLGR